MVKYELLILNLVNLILAGILNDLTDTENAFSVVNIQEHKTMVENVVQICVMIDQNY